MPELQDSQDREDRTPLRESQDPRDHPDLRDSPASQDNQESQEPPLRAPHLSQALQVPQEMLERPDSQEAQDSQEAMEPQDQLDPRDPQERQEAQETMASPERPVSQDSQAVAERRESAPSTAPSMVECSSRMELAVAKQRRTSEEPEGDFICQGLLKHCHILAIGLLLFGVSLTGKLRDEKFR